MDIKLTEEMQNFFNDNPKCAVLDALYMYIHGVAVGKRLTNAQLHRILAPHFTGVARKKTITEAAIQSKMSELMSNPKMCDILEVKCGVGTSQKENMYIRLSNKYPLPPIKEIQEDQREMARNGYYYKREEVKAAKVCASTNIFSGLYADSLQNYEKLKKGVLKALNAVKKAEMEAKGKCSGTALVHSGLFALPGGTKITVDQFEQLTGVPSTYSRVREFCNAYPYITLRDRVITVTGSHPDPLPSIQESIRWVSKVKRELTKSNKELDAEEPDPSAPEGFAL